MLYCEVELCLAASTFGRGGILSENRKGGQVTVHSAKNTTKFNSTVGRSATHADQVNLGVAAALRSNVYGGVPRATSLTTTVSGGPGAALRSGLSSDYLQVNSGWLGGYKNLFFQKLFL